MAGWTELGTGARAGVIAAGTAAVVLIAALWPREDGTVPPAEVAAPEPQAAVAPSTDAPPAAPEPGVPEAEGAEPVMAEPASPEAAAPVAEAEAAPDEAEPEASAAPEADADVAVAPEPEAAAPVAAAETAAEAAEPETVAAPEAEQAPAVSAAPEAGGDSSAGAVVPRFDGYRVEADGAAVVSGRAAPLAEVAVLVDGAVVATTTAGRDGSFAALFTLPPNPDPSLMVLQSTLPGAEPVLSEQSVALGPIAGPVIAALEPDPAEGAGEPAAAPGEATADAAQAEPAPEPEAPVALLLTEDGATVVQGPDAALDLPVVLDAISYAPGGDVRLAGRGAPGQSVRLYLDGAPVAEAAIDPAGRWQITLGDTAPGVYTLRVDQVDAKGTVTARFETPFKRETLEALASLAQGAAADPVPPAAPEQGPVAEAVAPPDLSKPTPPGGEAVPVQPDATAAAPEPAASVPPAAVTADAAAEPQGPVSITVQPGFTLWGIARDSLGEGVMYVQVYEANRDKIRDPDLIYPGQVFTLPSAP